MSGIGNINSSEHISNERKRVANSQTISTCNQLTESLDKILIDHGINLIVGERKTPPSNDLLSTTYHMILKIIAIIDHTKFINSSIDAERNINSYKAIASTMIDLNSDVIKLRPYIQNGSFIFRATVLEVINECFDFIDVQRI